MPSCFIAMPITMPPDRLESYHGDAAHFQHVLEMLFVPAVEAAGFDVVPPQPEGSEVIHVEIVRNLETCELVLCDISCLNPNVFFELGIRTALNRSVCMVRDNYTDHIPFDTGSVNFHTYDATLASWDLTDEVQRLSRHVAATGQRGDGRNALWDHIRLTQRGTDAIEDGTDRPEGAAMAVLLEEVRGLRLALDGRDQPAPRGPLASADRQTRSQWLSAMRVEGEPFGDEIGAFLTKAQEVASNDGVKLGLVSVVDRAIALRVESGQLSERGLNLITALARSYGVKAQFAR